MKHKNTTGTVTHSRKMDFDGFQNALLEISFKKGLALGQLIEEIAHAAGEGPTNNGGTVAEANRFYDDKTTYTGSAAKQFKGADTDIKTNTYKQQQQVHSPYDIMANRQISLSLNLDNPNQNLDQSDSGGPDSEPNGYYPDYPMGMEEFDSPGGY